jgi:GPI ethanolamine phosphate transferase 3 subunit O
LRSLSKPGGTHENTLLLVMGDHGQTLNGDHGGGTAEEVIFFLFGCEYIAITFNPVLIVG